MVKILNDFLETVTFGIEKACILGNGICPTYFTYEVLEYEKVKDGCKPLKFMVREVPYFLEGPVRYLKLKTGKEKKENLYEQVRHSDLYDEKLSMYKVNASLQDASFELGRARAFTPGWLENESIWLHMEYKYLLELIRNGMYEAFLRISIKLRSRFWIRKYMEEVFMRIHPLSQAVKIQTKHITAKVLWHA